MGFEVSSAPSEEDVSTSRVSIASGQGLVLIPAQVLEGEPSRRFSS